MFSDSPELNFGTDFEQSENEFTRLFWVVLGLVFKLLLVLVCCFVCYCLKN